MLTRKQISDKVAADALASGGKSGPLPTHSAMSNTEQNPDASATDASQDDDDDWSDDQ